MPFPEDQVYLRFEFGWRPASASSDIEIQDFGLWGTIDRSGPAVFPAWQDVANAVAAQGVAAWKANATPTLFATPVKARRCIAYHYDQAHEEVLHRGEAPFADATSWTGSGDPLPPQLTVAISTFGFEPGTFVPQPRRKRGRFYPPTLAAGQVGSDGELNSGNQSGWLEAMVSFFNQLTGALDVDGAAPGSILYFRPAVVSPTGQISTKISHLRVGRTIDTQRRRRNKLAEAYLSDEVNT